jgi:mono/diheme cytochrome c family protein
MKKNLVNAALMVMLAGCASTPEGGPMSAATPTADAPAAEGSAASAFYTSRQASRGAGLFRDNCVSCHASSEFTGASFERRWRNRAVADIYEFVLYSMPDDNPGGLPEQTYADIIAYVLEMNDFPAGNSELPTSMEALMEMKMWGDADGDG